MVMVKKKDGSMRFCVDFRKMNDATIKDTHPLPRIDDTLESLHGSQYFTTLDLKSAYWQVPIKEENKEKTAFRTSNGQLHEFNQLPFRLCNAPVTFSRLMDRTLAGLATRAPQPTSEASEKKLTSGTGRERLTPSGSWATRAHQRRSSRQRGDQET